MDVTVEEEPKEILTTPVVVLEFLLIELTLSAGSCRGTLSHFTLFLRDYANCLKCIDEAYDNKCARDTRYRLVFQNGLPLCKNDVGSCQRSVCECDHQFAINMAGVFEDYSGANWFRGGFDRDLQCFKKDKRSAGEGFEVKPVGCCGTKETFPLVSFRIGYEYLMLFQESYLPKRPMLCRTDRDDQRHQNLLITFLSTISSLTFPFLSPVVASGGSIQCRALLWNAQSRYSVSVRYILKLVTKYRTLSDDSHHTRHLFSFIFLYNRPFNKPRHKKTILVLFY